MLVHLEHADAVLTEDLAELVVGNNFPLVLGILQVVLANVIPNLRNDLAARKRIATNYSCQFRRRLNRPCQSAACFLPSPDDFVANALGFRC